MIYVECKPDAALTRHVAGLGKGAVSEARGKGEVCRKLMRGRNLVGLVDEDPESKQPGYLRRLTLRYDNDALGLKAYRDASRNNALIVICPKLEDWIIRAARDARLRLDDYGLPAQSDKLHDEINLDMRKLTRLLTDLTEAGSPRLRQLRNLLLNG